MERFKTILIFILLLISMFLFYQNRNIQPEVFIKDSIVIKTDTIFSSPIVTKLYDKELTLPLWSSLDINLPDSIKTDTIYVEYITKDSVKVHIPIKEYTYKKDSLYNIKISGYDVNLLSVSIYDKIQTRYVIKPPPIITFGPIIGYGLLINNKGFHNGVILGVGAKINISSLFRNGNLRNNSINYK